MSSKEGPQEQDGGVSRKEGWKDEGTREYRGHSTAYVEEYVDVPKGAR